MTTYGTNIHFFFDEVKAELRDRSKLKTYLHHICRKEKVKLYSLHVIFVSDEALLEMNKEYLNHDFYTDIITFDLSGRGGGIAGELYISIDRVRDNAQTNGQTLRKELHRVIFHGLLHLCGYADKSEKEIAVMRSKEEQYLKGYFQS